MSMSITVTVYAYLSNLLWTDDRNMLSAEFELVMEKKVEPFIHHDRTALEKDDLTDEARLALQYYFDYGVDSNEFKQVKSEYLDDSFFRFLNVSIPQNKIIRYEEMSNDEEDGGSVEILCYSNSGTQTLLNIGHFYHLKLTENNIKVGDAIVSIFNPFLFDYEAFGRVDQITYDRHADDILRQVYKIEPESDNGNDRVITTSIDSKTNFTNVFVLDVGAALCVTIYAETIINKKKSSYLAAVFDMGTTDKLSKSKITKIKLTQIGNLSSVQRNQAELYHLLNSINYPIDIFISHWHADHINFAVFCTQILKDNFWKNAIFHVPETEAPSATTIQNRLKKAKAPAKNWNVYKTYLCEQSPQLYEFNDRFVMGKVDCSKKEHPHHHGIFVDMCLISKKAILLSGDCTYAGIWDKQDEPDKYDYLQVCHHGGDYSLPPWNGKKKRKRDIFVPVAYKKHDIAVASADGASYGHPTDESIKAHQAKGWDFKSTHNISDDFYEFK